DVLANLPGDALRMREDQEVITQDEVFETPFSTKAAEDAQRFASKSEAGPASDAGLTEDAGLTKDAAAGPRVGQPTKVEPMEVAPAAPLPRGMAQKPAEESQVKSEPAELPRVAWPKTQSARVAILAPVDAPVTAAVPQFDAKDAVAKASALQGDSS